MTKQETTTTNTFLNRKEVLLDDNGEPHIIRYILWGKKGGLNQKYHGRGLYLQKIITSDTTKDLYDHPWRWGRFILWGHFMEKTQNKASPIVHSNQVGAFNLKPLVSSRFAHTIELLDNKPVWILFWHGRARNQWGFWVEHKKVSWREYLGIQNSNKITQD